MTTDLLKTQMAEIEESSDRMAGLVLAFGCAFVSLSALFFALAYLPK